jgi:hypothetical protein
MGHPGPPRTIDKKGPKNIEGLINKCSFLYRVEKVVDMKLAIVGLGLALISSAALANVTVSPDVATCVANEAKRILSTTRYKDLKIEFAVDEDGVVVNRGASTWYRLNAFDDEGKKFYIMAWMRSSEVEEYDPASQKSEPKQVCFVSRKTTDDQTVFALRESNHATVFELKGDQPLWLFSEPRS